MIDKYWTPRKVSKHFQTEIVTSKPEAEPYNLLDLRIRPSSPAASWYTLPTFVTKNDWWSRYGSQHPNHEDEPSELLRYMQVGERGDCPHSNH